MIVWQMNQVHQDTHYTFYAKVFQVVSFGPITIFGAFLSTQTDCNSGPKKSIEYVAFNIINLLIVLIITLHR